MPAAPCARLNARGSLPINAGAMALRLTDAAAARVPALASTAAAPPPAESLAARAAARLAARDLPGYLALFAEAAEVADVHRRYEARRALLEAGLAAKGASVAAVAPVLAAVARAALDVLDADPAEPVLLTYAGVAFYELGRLGAAEALFRAAARLAPDEPHLADNLDEIKRRRRAGLDRLKLPPALGVAVGELAARAERVASSARPATGLRISLCMIVKDEEAMLGRCLAAVTGHVDELIVVDTGSTDRTVAIAEEHGARVLHHAWTGDFSAARNVSLEAATGDWILWLDADEVLVDGDGPRLRALAGHTWREAFYLVETNHTGDLEDGTAVHHNALRLLRNRPEYRFEGRLHEQFAHHLPGYLPERVTTTDVRIDHFGYLGVVRDAKEKSRRNIDLLQRQIAEGAQTPFLHFNLGSELVVAGDSEAGLAEFREAWRLAVAEGALTRRGYIPSLAGRLVKTLRRCGHHAEAAERAAEVLGLFPGFTDVVFEQALMAETTGDLDEAERLFARCLEMGDAPSRYTATVGCGTSMALLGLAGVARRRGDLARAEELVVRCLDEHPGYLAAVEPYAATRLAAGRPAAEVVAGVHAAVGELGPGSRFMLAVALHEAGAGAEAEHELRAVVAARPDSAPARLALAEAQLSQGRFAGALETLDALDPDSPYAGAAARTRLFALLAEGRAAGALALLAAAPPLPTGELAAFGAWRAVLAGDEAPLTLPAEAGAPIATMLEALARVEAFDAFELLAGVLEAVALPWRERRELLAGVYLRRGFLDSAADEWIAVCDREGPDAAALLGLAQVAWARGLDDDVELFAREVLALSPGHAGASALLEHLAAQASV